MSASNSLGSVSRRNFAFVEYGPSEEVVAVEEKDEKEVEVKEEEALAWEEVKEEPGDVVVESSVSVSYPEEPGDVCSPSRLSSNRSSAHDVTEGKDGSGDPGLDPTGESFLLEGGAAARDQFALSSGSSHLDFFQALSSASSSGRENLRLADIMFVKRQDGKRLVR
jgi:hypothetical protein